VELLRAKEPLERLFYEVEAIKNNWSVKELERAFDSGLYVRTGLSTNKEAVIAKFKNMNPAQPADVIRDPYFLEFIGLEEKIEYSETELEELILNHLQQFLVELGTGFCFEARQKRITFDNTHYRIDLVFYHRILKSHILIDLKIGKFTHADAGQMTVYLNYYKDNEMTEGDNPPVGIILCGDKNETLVKYATSTDNQLFVSQYLVKLPEKKVFVSFMKKELNQ
jgi:predicted nuclease of restriction endonuclease-like (RecB) superfamily